MVPTVHGVDGLEGHYLGGLGVGAGQQLLQVLAVVVAEDEALGTAVPDALDHRSVVPCVGVDLAAWRTHAHAHAHTHTHTQTHTSPPKSISAPAS